jgi:polyisoprenoid-binding protein YceI
VKFYLTLLLGAVFATAFSARAADVARPFDLKDEKGVNAVTYSIPDSLEPYSGFSNDVRGQVLLDLDKPEAATGKVVIGMKALNGSNSFMAESMKGGWCLDVEKYPEATFEIVKFEPTEKSKTQVSGQVTGDFTIKGVTKRITVPAKAVFYADKLSEREGGERKGDVLVLGTDFTFDRRDYKIGTSVGPEMVGNEIKISLHVAATRVAAK